MQAIAVVNHILDHLVKQGKHKIHDQYLNTQKVPVFSNTRTHNYQQQSIIQSGLQVSKPYRNNYLSMRNEKQPHSLQKDRLCSKASIQKQLVNKSCLASPEKAKSDRRSFSYSGLKNNKIKTGGFSWTKKDVKTKATQKQNQFIKLENDYGKRRVIEKTVQRQSMEEDRLREEKKISLLKEYQAKMANEIFERDRLSQRIAKQKEFEQHMRRGEGHKFMFHQGQLILFKQQGSKGVNKGPKETEYQLQEDHTDPQSYQQTHTYHRFPRKSPKVPNKLFHQLTENHRIRSARGEAFASAVLKTINLSRISLNQTLRNLQDDQFMKRNDLFNNNHARQTTSIPYLLPKSGTVYTELSTNQVVTNKCQTERRESFSMKSETTRNPISSKRMSHFQPYIYHDISNQNQSERNRRGKRLEDSQQLVNVNGRSIRTAEAAKQQDVERDKRPKTSVSKGRINRANGELVLSLLQ